MLLRDYSPKCIVLHNNQFSSSAKNGLACSMKTLIIQTVPLRAKSIYSLSTVNYFYYLSSFLRHKHVYLKRKFRIIYNLRVN